MVLRSLHIVVTAVLVLSCTGPESSSTDPPGTGAPLTTVQPDDGQAVQTSPASPAGASEEGTDAEVVLQVGDDFQAIIDQHGPGTAYRIAAGVHRLQQVTPQDGDVFVGESGAVLSGARDISDGVVEWRRDGDDWYVDGQTQEGSTRGVIREGGRERDLHPEDVFVDGQRYVHVDDRGALGAGRYFFDYEDDRIWLADDPSALGLIETSVRSFAFSGDEVADVRVENLVIERYASPAQHGAVGGRRTYGWTLRRLDVRDNHGGGIRMGPGMTIEDSSVVNNGQIGIVGTGVDEENGYTAPVVIRRNEIARNNVLDYDPTWEGGGTKFTRTPAGIVVEHNWIHGNEGHGLWFDLHAYNVTARNNLIESNRWRGIFYEISHGPHPELGGTVSRITANEVRSNGHGAEDVRRGAAIFVSNSEDVEVTDNWLHDNHGGIVVRQTPGREADTARVLISGNDIGYDTGCTGFLIDGYSGREARQYAREAEVSFADNRYLEVSSEPFCWIDDDDFGYTEWADLHDSDALATEAPVTSPPAMASALAHDSYGAD